MISCREGRLPRLELLLHKQRSSGINNKGYRAGLCKSYNFHGQHGLPKHNIQEQISHFFDFNLNLLKKSSINVFLYFPFSAKNFKCLNQFKAILVPLSWISSIKCFEWFEYALLHMNQMFRV